MDNLIIFGKPLPPLDEAKLPKDPDWKQCDPAFIRKALDRALKRPSGGWYVVDQTRAFGLKPKHYKIDGKELVAFRAGGKIHIAPHSCPHIGGPLASGRMKKGKLVCPWHGLQLPSDEHRHWRPYDTFDDGILTWVRLGSEEEATPQPIIPQRPHSYIDAVIRKEAACEAADIIANRLDPWHGHHYHPHTFARLKVTEVTLDKITLRVAYRVAGPLCVEVDAVFFSPEPRTIVMTIIDGEGVGSMVETHATPIEPGKSAVIEATIAESGRLGFQILKQFSFLLRPFIEKAAHRLWVEDVAYAERAYVLRGGKSK